MDKITTKKTLSFVLPCPIHPGEQIVRACNDLSCNNQCIYCPQCEKLDKQHPYEHRNHMRPISELLAYLSSEIEKFGSVGKTANTFLLEDRDKNLRIMAKHLKDQKSKLEKDFKQMIEDLVAVMKQKMKEMLDSLDKQYEIFERNYEIFKGSYGRNTTNNPYQSFSNSHSLISKLKSMSSVRDQSDLLKSIKHHVNENQIAASAFAKSSPTHSRTKAVNESFHVEDLLKKQIQDPPTYSSPEIGLLSQKLLKFSQKINKIFENHIFFYPFRSVLPFMAFRNLKLPPGQQTLEFEITNNHKNVVLELETLQDFLLLNPIEALETNHEKPLQAMIALSNDIIATGSGDNVIKVWDLVSKKLLKNLFGNSSTISGFCLFHLTKNRGISIKDYKRKFSEHGFLLINSDIDRNLVVWDSDLDKSMAATQFKMIRGHDFNITCMQEIENGENLISGDEKGFIIVWNILLHKSVFKSVTTKTSHRKAITSINVVDSYKRFITSDQEGVILIWEIFFQKSLKNGLETISDCKISHVIKENYGGIINMCQRTTNPNILISCHEKGKIVVWTLKDDTNKIKSQILIEDIQDVIHQIALVELKEKPKEFAVFCLLSQKHGVCVVNSEGKITAAIKVGSQEDLVSNSVNPNYKFQFVGNKKPLLAILNQSRERKTIGLLEINI